MIYVTVRYRMFRSETFNPAGRPKAVEGACVSYEGNRCG